MSRDVAALTQRKNATPPIQHSPQMIAPPSVIPFHPGTAYTPQQPFPPFNAPPIFKEVFVMADVV